MSSKLVIEILIVIILVVVGGFFWLERGKDAAPVPDIATNDIFDLPPAIDKPVACTKDAKVCPDGSVVGRVAPSCNFTECPVVQNEVNDDIIPDWQTIQTDSFIILLPPEWQYLEKQGLDSFVGEFTNNKIILTFDYGWYSSSLVEDNDPNHIVTFEAIDGYNAKIVVPKITENGTTGVYFADLGGNIQKTKFNISGIDIISSQQETVLEIFRSIKFIE